MLHVLKSEDEDQYFEGSAELMRMCSALVSQAHFNESTKNVTTIPYAQQALEYAMDIVQEYIEKQKEHHKKRTFKEEYLAFLKAFEIDFNDEYLFEWIDDSYNLVVSKLSKREKALIETL